MDIETMKHFGLTKELEKADYFETEHYKTMLSNVKLAIKSGGIIALTGIVGIGKTVSLRRIQHRFTQAFNHHLNCKNYLMQSIQL